MKYRVHKLAQPMKLDGDWEKAAWKNCPTLELKNFMGTKPAHQPRTQAKALYDDRNIYVTFRVEDRYVRAVAQKHQDSVCRDSCVEFFFTPGDDISVGYFNLEMNCGGTMLLYYIKKPLNEDPKGFVQVDCEPIEVFHSLPKIVEPEIVEPTTWVVEYRIPLDLLEKHCPVVKPRSGVLWRGNFYKCADSTSHPHWLTWSVVDNPKPSFHLPKFFGELEFV
ncbi:MAG: carbohydrate-binding family 9-like protein [Phycisphaerae bacterium]